MQYTGERRLLGIAAMHKSSTCTVFEDDKQYFKRFGTNENENI